MFEIWSYTATALHYSMWRGFGLAIWIIADDAYIVGEIYTL